MQGYADGRRAPTFDREVSCTPRAQGMLLRPQGFLHSLLLGPGPPVLGWGISCICPWVDQWSPIRHGLPYDRMFEAVGSIRGVSSSSSMEGDTSFPCDPRGLVFGIAWFFALRMDPKVSITLLLRLLLAGSCLVD